MTEPLDVLFGAVHAIGPGIPFPKRIVVDEVMMRTLKAAIPNASERGYTFHTFAGVPIVVDNIIGEARGFIEHANGHIEKFGRWPTKEEPVFDTESAHENVIELRGDCVVSEMATTRCGRGTWGCNVEHA